MTTDFTIPDIRQNNDNRMKKLDGIIEPIPPHPSDVTAFAGYLKEMEKRGVGCNRGNVGVEREQAILLQVLDNIEPNREMQKQLIAEAAKQVPLSNWLKIQLAKRDEQERLEALKQREKEEKEAKKAKKRQESPGQLSIMDEPGVSD